MTVLKWYTAYNSDTGEILKVFSDDGATVELNTPQGASILEGRYDWADGYIQNSTFIQKTPKPSVYHVFDWTTKTWIDPRTLEDLKSEKWEEIKAIRDQKEYGGFIWNNYNFDSDQISQGRILGAAQLATILPSYSVDWTLADNSVITLNSADVLNVAAAMGQYVSGIHSTARGLRDDIQSSTSAVELQQISWPLT